MKKWFLIICIACFSIVQGNAKVYELTDEIWENLTLGQRPIVVDVYATWCAPCRTYSPIFERLSQEFAGRVDFYKIDAERNEDFVYEYDVSAIPTTVFFYGSYAGDCWTEVGVMNYTELRAQIIKAINRFEYERSISNDSTYPTEIDYLCDENTQSPHLDKDEEYFNNTAVRGIFYSLQQLCSAYRQIGMLIPLGLF